MGVATPPNLTRLSLNIVRKRKTSKFSTLFEYRKHINAILAPKNFDESYENELSFCPYQVDKKKSITENSTSKKIQIIADCPFFVGRPLGHIFLMKESQFECILITMAWAKNRPIFINFANVLGDQIGFSVYLVLISYCMS